MPILESIFASLAAKAVLFVAEKTTTGTLDKIKLENDLKQALISACDDLNNDYPTIDRYIELFFSDTTPGAIRQESLLTALFSNNETLIKVFIKRFTDDFTSRLALLGTLETPPVEYSQIDFNGMKAKFPDGVTDDFIARSIAERFLGLLKEKIERINLPLEQITEKIFESQEKAHKKLNAIRDSLAPFDYLTPQFFMHYLPKRKDSKEYDDYYYGVERGWGVIVTNRDFRREELQESLEKNLLRETDDTLFVPIVGNAKSGKTTFLMRLASTLVWKYEKDVLWLKPDHSGAITTDQIQDIYDTIRRPLYIFYDNIVNKNPKWDEFINGLNYRKIPCYVIGSMYTGQWDIHKAPPDNRLILKNKEQRKPFAVENTIQELELFFEKISSLDIKGIIDKKEAIRKALLISRDAGELFLNFIYYYKEDRSFKDSILDSVRELRKEQYLVYDGLAWLATFYQFGIYTPKSLIRKIVGDAIESALVTQPLAQKYVFQSDDMNSFYIFNQLVAGWIFESYIREVGNGGRLRERLGWFFDTEREYDQSELEKIFFLFWKFASEHDHQAIIKSIYEMSHEVIKKQYDGLTPEFLAFVVASIFFKLSLYEETCDILDIVTKRKPEFPDAYVNWGTALAELADTRGDEKLFEQSFKKYEKAVNQEHILPEAYYTWGNVLSFLGNQKKNEEFLRQSLEKYEIAVTQRPIYPEVYNAWGSALAILADLKRDEGLFQLSFEKYEIAVKQEPINPEAHSNWGLALSNLARLKAEGLFQQSLRKYKTAVDQKQIFPEAYYNWGNTLSDLTKINGEVGLYQEAIIKYLLSGFTFIVSGKMEDRPFTGALEIEKIEGYHCMLCNLFILSIRKIKGDDWVAQNREPLLQDREALLQGRESFPNANILLTLNETLLGEKSERQNPEKEDDAMVTAAKILINRLIDTGDKT